MKRRYKDRRTKGIAVVTPSPIYSDSHYVKSLRVDLKGRGGGSRIMKRIIRDADKEKTTLYLVVVPSGPMNETQLRAWYQKLGFENYGAVWMRRIHSAARKPANNGSAVRNRKAH